MDVHKIMYELIDSPDAVKFYRELKKYYDINQLTNESLAITHLLEQKFEKNNENSPNNSNNN